MANRTLAVVVDEATFDAINQCRGLVPAATWLREVAIKNELERCGFVQHEEERTIRVGRPLSILKARNEPVPAE